MYNKINDARNKFYTKLIKLTANKDRLNEEEITEVLKAQQELIDTILEFKHTSDNIKARLERFTKEIQK